MAWDVVVVGGGVAGLVAARGLAATGRDVLLLEASPQLGGKLRSAEVAGLTVDVGAEAMLARRPEGLDLAHELGTEVLHPTAATSGVWSRGALRALPRSLMGVPLDLDQLAASGVLSPDGLARASSETPTDVSDDVSVGDLVASRLGDEVVERLVEPLLGGVYAGHARRISAAAAVPQLLAMARRGSLLDQAARPPGLHRARSSPPSPAGWVACPAWSSTAVASRHGPPRRSASCGVRRPAGRSPSARPRTPRPSRRPPSCWPRLPRRRPACWPTSHPASPPSSRRSSPPASPS